MRPTVRLLLVAALLAVGCEPADGDRCPDGYTYHPDGKYCSLDGDSDTGPADTDVGDAGPPSGLGEACETDEDCADYEADYCGINPLSGDGYCTVDGCESGECYTGYTCCDCLGIEGLDSVACVTDEDAELLVEMAGCSCG